jgi:hypothetical protein
MSPAEFDGAKNQAFVCKQRNRRTDDISEVVIESQGKSLTHYFLG